jgi:glycerol kinase
VCQARARADQGQLACGTIDTFLLWRLTGGLVHATDATNASRTMLYDIRTGGWDDELLRLLNVPRSILPEVRDSAGDFGVTDPTCFDGQIRIAGIAGDQQAASLGQACFKPGMMKSTYGTGCFALLNTGSEIVTSDNRLLTTVALQLKGMRTYALEGSIFVAGASVQWLRDGLKVINSAAETGALSDRADAEQEVILVPAFVGLGAPYWKPEARAALFGMTRNTGPAELARAALMSVAYQTRDLLEAMRGDWPSAGETVLRVDGGMVASDWTLQFLADILDAPVDRPTTLETTALGAAWLAGHAAGVWPDQVGFADHWRLDRRFEAKMSGAERDQRYGAWKRAVRATLEFTGN